MFIVSIHIIFVLHSSACESALSSLLVGFLCAPQHCSLAKIVLIGQLNLTRRLTFNIWVDQDSYLPDLLTPQKNQNALFKAGLRRDLVTFKTIPLDGILHLNRSIVRSSA